VNVEEWEILVELSAGSTSVVASEVIRERGPKKVDQCLIEMGHRGLGVLRVPKALNRLDVRFNMR